MHIKLKVSKSIQICNYYLFSEITLQEDCKFVSDENFVELTHCIFEEDLRDKIIEDKHM